MDPNAALAQIRQLVAAYNEASDTYEKAMGDGDDASTKEYEQHEDALLEVVQAIVPLVEGLDEWLTRGGFPPEAWREGPDAPEYVTGDGFQHSTREQAMGHAHEVHNRTGHIIAVEPLGPPNPAHGELPE